MLAPESSSSLFPNHLCHTNTPSCPSGPLAHNTPVLWHQPGVRLLMITRGPQIGDIINPQAEGAKQLATHRGRFESCELGFQPPNGYSGQGTEARKKKERVNGTFGKLIDFTTLELCSLLPLLSTLPVPFHLKCLWTAVGIWVRLTHHPAG